MRAKEERTHDRGSNPGGLQPSGFYRPCGGQTVSLRTHIVKEVIECGESEFIYSTRLSLSAKTRDHAIRS